MLKALTCTLALLAVPAAASTPHEDAALAEDRACGVYNTIGRDLMGLRLDGVDYYRVMEMALAAEASDSFLLLINETYRFDIDGDDASVIDSFGQFTQVTCALLITGDDDE